MLALVYYLLWLTAITSTWLGLASQCFDTRRYYLIFHLASVVCRGGMFTARGITNRSTEARQASFVCFLECFVPRPVNSVLGASSKCSKPTDRIITMPEISRFFGIVIAIYYKEHGLPHFHAKYSGQTGVFSITELKLIEGNLPKRVIALVLEWAFEHRDELMQNWELAMAQKPLRSIQPLE